MSLFYINAFLNGSECFLDLFLINTGEELTYGKKWKKLLILNVINIKSINTKISLVPYRFRCPY